MKSVQDIQFRAKRVLLRADFNVPMDEHNRITDDSRITTVLPTIRHILQEQGRLIICSHMGRPKGQRMEEFSLAPIALHLEALLGMKVTLAPDCVGEEVEAMVDKMTDGQVVLLENLRFHKGETDNDPA